MKCKFPEPSVSIRIIKKRNAQSQFCNSHKSRPRSRNFLIIKFLLNGLILKNNTAKKYFQFISLLWGAFSLVKLTRQNLTKAGKNTVHYTFSAQVISFNQSQREWMVFALQMYSNIFKRFQSFLKAFASCYSIYSNCINLSNFSSQATRLLQQNVSF